MAATRSRMRPGGLGAWVIASLLCAASCRGCGDPPQPRPVLDAGVDAASPDAAPGDAAADAAADGLAGIDQLTAAGWTLVREEPAGRAFLPSEAESARLVVLSLRGGGVVLARELRFGSEAAAQAWLRVQPPAHEAPLPLRRVARGSVALELTGLDGAAAGVDAAAAALEGR